MTVRWAELTEEERATLVALSQSPVLTLTVAMAARLEVLGLAQPGFGGTVSHGHFRTRLGVAPPARFHLSCSFPMRRFAKASSRTLSES